MKEAYRMSDTAPNTLRAPDSQPTRCQFEDRDESNAYRHCTRTRGHSGEHQLGAWSTNPPGLAAAAYPKVNTPEQDELNAALQAGKSDAITQAAREGATPPALAYSSDAATLYLDTLSDVLDWLNECELEDSDAPQIRARIRRVLDQEQPKHLKPLAQATIGAPDYFTIVREAAAQDARRIAAEATLAAARAALRWFTEDGHGIAAAAHFAAAHETQCQLAAAIALADGVNARTEPVDPRDVDPRD